MYIRPEIEGQPTTFGVSGKLWRDSLVMYDRTSLSLWSQVQGRAVAGPREGERLGELPSVVSTWGAWKTLHPNSLVLVKPPLKDAPYAPYFRNTRRVGLFWSKNGDKRLPAKELVFGIARDDGQVAVPLTMLQERFVVNAMTFEGPTVFFSPVGEQAVGAFSRDVDGRALTFDSVGTSGAREVRDVETGSRWAWDRGICVQGPLEGRRLEPLAGTLAFWAIWARHYPQTRILTLDEEP